jgi:stearoyl-CoA desaturase (delta-9 desaturase)
MSAVTNLEKEQRGKPIWKEEIGFLLIHLTPLLIFWTGATWFDWVLCISLYFIRMFFVTGIYHRYFSHSTFKTNRFFQAIFAFMAETSLQKGVLHWAANHRVHHKYSDTPKDPHSKKIYGFWYSHVGWIIGPDFKETKYNLIKDFAKYPELIWLNKHHLVPPATLMIFVFFFGGYMNAKIAGVDEITFMEIINHGWSSLIVGFFLSTILLFHGTFSINSLMHMFGKKRYESNDESKNNLILALITLGEGWHNNHHYYQSTARQGFYWWEIDITYYILKVMSWFGIVRDLKPVPKHIKDSRSKEEAKQLKKEYSKKQNES